MTFHSLGLTQTRTCALASGWRPRWRGERGPGYTRNGQPGTMNLSLTALANTTLVELNGTNCSS